MPVRYSSLGARQKPSGIVGMMALALERPDLLSLAAGFTDTETLPLEDVREIIGSFSGSKAIDLTALQYGTNQGRPLLRDRIARHIECQDGLSDGAYSGEDLLISNGSQQALYLAVQTLCDPGDIVLVEDPTYFVFLEILHGLGVRAIPLPMREGGDIDLEGVETLLSEFRRSGEIDRVKALYLVSYFSNPSAHSIGEQTKKGIGSMLSRYAPDIAVIEDAAYRDLFFETAFASRSCLALDEFKGLAVFYTSTLTKSYASGLKVGYAYCTDREWLASMLSVKGQHDFGTSNFAQKIMELAFAENRFERHLSKLRRAYSAKMACLDEAIASPLREIGWEWNTPEGGLYLWLKSPNGIETCVESSFHKACLDSGVMYVPGSLCSGNGGLKERVRLSFGVLDEKELREAGQRFSDAARAI